MSSFVRITAGLADRVAVIPVSQKDPIWIRFRPRTRISNCPVERNRKLVYNVVSIIIISKNY